MPQTETDFLTTTAIPHLRAQFERARVVLFTGAGFSLPAKNLAGTTVPSPSQLSRLLWQVAFPSETFDPNSSLRDIFDTALARSPKKLKECLVRHLTVAPSSLQEWIPDYFRLPWHRIYTLNVDSLATAVQQQYDLPRRLVSTSGTRPEAGQSISPQRDLEVVHLNGTLDDAPGNVTFSESQYAQMLASPNKAFQELTADLLVRPVVFVGTRLDESPLWQSIERRRLKGQRGARELRPRSYLVTPSLDRARQARLARFNIAWIQMTAQELAHDVLPDFKNAGGRGFSFLGHTEKTSHAEPRLPDVAELAVSPGMPSEFLFGAQPIWADVQAGRAIRRECDETFLARVKDQLSSERVRGVVALTGTAGSGKTTCLMRLALRLSADGVRVGWVDATSDLSERAIVAAMHQQKAPPVLAIDSAENYGRNLATMLREVASLGSSPLIVVSVRAGRIDTVLNRVVLADVPVKEVTVPHLADSDIDALIAALDHAKRLGALQGKTLDQQRETFRDYAGRQLLVAMISATSGKRFEEKVDEEYDDLQPNARLIYATASLATYFNYSLQRQEILMAINDFSNDQLNAIERLLNRHILSETPPGSGRIQTRHRLIAERLWRTLQQRGVLADVVDGLGLFAATLPIQSPHQRRARRLLVGLTNHDFLHRAIGLERSKSFYEKLEDILFRDFHYWLQRGSLEVEFGDLALAENFLNQARGLEPNDTRVENEWAYLLSRQAIEAPLAERAQPLMDSAMETLRALIAHPRRSPYPYHVLGSQGLAWSRCAPLSWRQREELLSDLRDCVKEGVRYFPGERKLRKLAKDLEREYLTLAVAKKPHGRTGGHR